MDNEINIGNNNKLLKGGKTRKAQANKIFRVIKAKSQLVKGKAQKKKDGLIKSLSDIDKDYEAVKNAKKSANLNIYKKIYFTEEDYIHVDELLRGGFGKKVEIEAGLLMARIREFRENLNNDMVKDIAKINEVNGNKEDIGELNEKEIEEVVNLAKSEIEKKQQFNLTEEESAFMDKMLEKFDENGNFISDKEKNKNMEDAMDENEIDEENNNKIIIDTRDPFKTNNDILANTMTSIEKSLSEINSRNNTIKLSGDLNSVWNNAVNCEVDIKKQWENFKSVFSDRNNLNQNIVLSACLASIPILFKTCMSLLDTCNKMGEYIKTDRENKIEIAKKGDKGINLNNKNLLKEKKKDDLKKDNKYIDDNEWKKLPLIDKICKRFIFNDFRQNIYTDTWNKLNKDDKIKFLKIKANWRAKRAAELDKMDVKQPGVIKMINNFLYYHWRDANGYTIGTPDIRNMEFYWDVDKTKNVDNLENKLKKANDDNKVKSFIVMDGQLLLTRGKAYYNIRIPRNNLAKSQPLLMRKRNNKTNWNNPNGGPRPKN